MSMDIGAPTLAKLAEALQKLPANGTWQVTKGNYGHASILVFNGAGKLIAEIRNAA